MTVSDLFRQGLEDHPPVQLWRLARELEVPSSDLYPLVEAGLLQARTIGQVNEWTQVAQPVPEAMIWLRSYLQPALDKPLFSLRDMGEILGCSQHKIRKSCLAAGIPVEPMLSTWQAKKLVMHLYNNSRSRQVRWDRQMMLWKVLGGDTGRLKKVPQFSDSLEQELERTARLDEPLRTIRLNELLAVFRDTRRLLESLPEKTDTLGLDQAIERVERQL